MTGRAAASGADAAVAAAGADVEVAEDVGVVVDKSGRPLVGIGYRHELSDFLESADSAVSCIELTAEHFFGADLGRLREISRRRPVYMHGLGLSLGTPGPVDLEMLKNFAAVADASNATWISDHISFCRAGGIDLGHLNPVPRTMAMVRTISENAMRVSDFCGKPMLLENITAHLDLGGMPEPDFINAICERANCGILLDVTNLYINARNLAFDELRWLDAMDIDRVRQIHVVGYAKSGHRLTDSHSAPIQHEIISLLREVLVRAPIEAVLLERDDRLGELAEIRNELSKIERVIDSVGTRYIEA